MYVIYIYVCIGILVSSDSIMLWYIFVLGYIEYIKNFW